MKWYTKLLVFLGVAVLVLIIGGMFYVVSAKYQMNDYAVQVGASFNAAMMVNADETHTDAQRAVVARYEGRSSIVVPENYKALLSYLRRDYAKPPFASVNKEQALHVSICDRSHVYIKGDSDGDGATILFESAGKSYVMHVAGGDLWDKVIKLCMDGTYKAPNLPFEE